MLCCSLLLLLSAAPAEHRAMTLSESLAPYDGPVNTGTDTSTLAGKVMAGYQGWFMAKGDGYQPGWVHWGGVDREPPRCTVDFWPDMSELGPEERFASNYRYADGTPAELFSSTVKPTVLRHFKWMQEYGIDGAFVQRFGSCISNQSDWNYQRTCAVLSHCREGANTYGRAFAVMYDIGFDRKAVDTVKADWARLVKEMHVAETPAYLKHRGGPVVALWGYGFGHRGFEAEAAEDLFKFLKSPEMGGCTIMLGLPNDWASWTDDRMRLLKQYGTIISPWNVGRYGSPEGAAAHAERYFPGDLQLCQDNDLDYYAVAFPGFSWTNLQQGNSPLNQTPRLGGKFFWSQIEQIRQYGMDTVYVAMFDEVDEGTAIFKCTNNPPQGRFCTYEGYPSDHYLNLAGLAGRYLRGEDVEFPNVTPQPVDYRPVPQLEYYRQPSKFDAETIARWKQAFAGVPIVLPAEPYSDWVAELYNTGAFDLRLSSWPEILAQPTASKLMLLAAGNEGFGTGADDATVARIVALAQKQVASGGTVLVMAGGSYPMFYPNSGREAAKFGFKLQMVNSPAGSQVTFAPEFGALPAWTMAKGGSARLMWREQYPDAKAYVPLATVTLPNGQPNGEAVAAVQPGGALGDGWVVYVARDLLGYPERERLLDAVLGWVKKGL